MSISPDRKSKDRVVILGAGFGGLAAAQKLKSADVEVVVIDQRNHHTFQPLLYQVASAGLDVGDVCYATRGIFHDQPNARAMQGRMIGLDIPQKRVELANGAAVHYDFLVLALGAVTADYGVPGVAKYGFGLKSGADAQRLRSHIVAQFEIAESSPTKERVAQTTIVVAGGGPTGVEMAGGFSELIDHVFRYDYPDIDVDQARVILVEGADRLLPSFRPRQSRKAQHKLERMGVEVLLSTQVSAVTDGGVVLDSGEEIETNTLVWAAGVKANPLLDSLGFATGRGGRAVVDEFLQVEGHDDIYIIGDLAATQLGDGSLAPQVAPVAIQGGQYVAARIKQQVLAGKQDRSASKKLAKLGAFAYKDKGSMATIGRNFAVVELPIGPAITGFIGWLAWLLLHLVMLMGFRNRIRVLITWAHNYLTYDRGNRVIIDSGEPS